MARYHLMNTKFKKNIMLDISARLFSLHGILLLIFITLHYMMRKLKLGVGSDYPKVTKHMSDTIRIPALICVASKPFCLHSTLLKALLFDLRHTIISFIILVYHSFLTVMFSSRLSM